MIEKIVDSGEKKIDSDRWRHRKELKIMAYKARRKNTTRLTRGQQGQDKG